MHERTQRAVSRLMFAFCCALPTLVTIICIVATWTPWYHRRVLSTLQTQLEQNTGLIFQIQNFTRPSPDSWHLESVRILEPETRREIARIREIHWVKRADEAVILLHQPELQSSQLRSVWKLVHDRFLCRPQFTDVPTQIVGNDLTIHSRTGALTLRDLDAWVRTDQATTEATIQFLPANSTTQSPLTITVRRDRSDEYPATEWLLDTQGTALPCSALAEYLPQLESLGSEATFRGSLHWRQQQEHWSIDLAGSRFEGISLDRLFEQNAHRISGTATVQLDRCRIEPHLRRSDLSGSIRSHNGWIGRSLLVSAKEHLGLEPRLPESWQAAPGDVPYDRLALGFNINNTQLHLEGVCQTEPGYESYPPGVVLVRDGYPLVYSTQTTLESLRLLSAMAPAHSVPVPLSNQTSWLTRILLPPSRPLPGDESLPPRIRAAGTWQGGPVITQPN